MARYIALAAVLTALTVALLTVALPASAATRPARHPVHAVPVAYNPCAPGHPPIDPDMGHCQGSHFIPS